MDLGLDGLTVLITGASGGIGRALTRTFYMEGAKLGLHANSRADALEDLVREEGLADRSARVVADVTDPAAVGRAVDAVVAAHGRIDVCVANAGVWPPDDLPLHRVPEDRIRRTLDIDLFGVLWTVRAFMAQLERLGPRADGRGASIILVGSTAGRFGERGHADYSVAKSALYGLVRSVKNEIIALDPYGRINMVEPGWTVTEMARAALASDDNVRRVLKTMPLQQLARAADVARMVAALASPTLSRHVSGEVITVAGGMEGRSLWEPDAIDVPRVRRRLKEP